MHEQGKPVTEAGGEIHHLIHGLNYYADLATKVRGSYQPLPSALSKAYGMVLRRPMGVVAAIVPNNFPLTLLGHQARAGADGGQHDRGQARGDDAADDAEDRRPAARGRVPARRRERHHGQGLGGRRRARHPRQGPPRRLHRLHRRRPPHHGPGRAEAEADDDGAGRLRPGDRRPRRQHQGRRARDRDRPLLELRPDVPRRQAHLRLRRGLRRADGAAAPAPSASTSPAWAGRRPRSRTSASARCTPSEGRDEIMEQLQDALDGGGELVLGGDKVEGAGLLHAADDRRQPRARTRASRARRRSGRCCRSGG